MLHTRTTPNGTLILHEDGLPDEHGNSKRRTYWLEEQTTEAKVPSITTVLGVMEKEGLHYAIEKLTLGAAIELAKDGGLPLDFEEALFSLKARSLTFRAQWNAKADKGTQTHDWLVELMADPSVPDPPGCEPFAKGIREWLEQYKPEAIQSEVMVCSTRHRFAGRFDLLAYLRALPLSLSWPLGCRCRTELKTMSELPRFKDGQVKPPYPEALLQLGGQELAARESGDPPSECQAVLRVDEQGDWDFFITVVNPEDYLAPLALYRTLRGLVPAAVEARIGGVAA
jgi:hypothetical protein